MARLTLTRGRKTQTSRNMFSEILQASAPSDCEQGAWSIAGSQDKDRLARRKVQESQQNKEREMHQDIMGLLRQQFQMPQTLVDLQVQQSSLPFVVNGEFHFSSSPFPSTFDRASGAAALPLTLHTGGESKENLCFTTLTGALTGQKDRFSTQRPHHSPSWENMVDKVLQKEFVFLVLIFILGNLLSGVFYRSQTKIMIPREDWLMGQVYRKDTLNSTCLMNNLSHSQNKVKHNVAKQIFVDHNHTFIYCEVPKVGCSNWKKIILLLTMNLSRKANEVNHDLIHKTPLIKRLSSYPSDYQEKLLTSYTKVMFTRDPLERLVSAYRDKLLHSEPYYSITVANEIKAMCRKNKNSTEKVTFQEFINFILTKNPELLDIHWKPMFLLCDPCNIHYDIMGKFETLEQDSEHVLRSIGAPEDMYYPNFKKYGSEKRTSDNITLEYLRKLSSEQIEKIKKLYKMDFALFNYPYDLKMNLYETDIV